MSVPDRTVVGRLILPAVRLLSGAVWITSATDRASAILGVETNELGKSGCGHFEIMRPLPNNDVTRAETPCTSLCPWDRFFWK